MGLPKQEPEIQDRDTSSIPFPTTPLPPPYPQPLRRLDPDAHVVPIHPQYAHRDGPGKPARRIGLSGAGVGFNKHGVAGATGEDEHP